MANKTNTFYYLRSFGFAMNGLKHAFAEHTSFRIEVCAAVVVSIAGVYYQISRIEWTLLMLVVFSVLVAELLNTAIETVMDYMTKEHHLSVKIAKDVAAGAVFLLSIGSLVIGLFIFLPHIIGT